MGEENINQTSKYNEAFLQLSRLDEYWRIAEQYALNGQLHRWYYVLDTIWRELVSDAKRLSNADNDYIKKNKVLKKYINKYWRDSKKLYTLLNKRHELLKEIQDDSGKGGKYLSEDESEY